MNQTCKMRFTREVFDSLMVHLYPGDGDEHGAIVLAGVSTQDEKVTLHVREVHPAREGLDYVEGKIGYRALTPQFIHRFITRARDERLAYLAVHNHEASSSVGFSGIDLRSHETGYPALLQIARGMPVGALVSGHHSLQSDVWMPDGRRLALEQAIVVGNTIRRLGPDARREFSRPDETYDRQVRMFGAQGQAELASARVGIIGLGGVGSLVSEYLARLGVGAFVVIDNDRVEKSNLSRIAGATSKDAVERTFKTEVARRIIMQANPLASVLAINDDAAKESAAKLLTTCDYLFLAADSMRARLVVNAIVHQYFIPGVQMGAKIRAKKSGELLDVLSVNRPLRPGRGCLWCNQLIDPNQLALESKSDKERRDQAYGVEEPNPSVITLNAVAAATAVNDFLLDYLGLREDKGDLSYQHFYHLQRRLSMVLPRIDADCPECSTEGFRFGRGDAVPLPCIEG